MLLDLWGVLADPRKMTPAYRERAANLLASRYARSATRWRDALMATEAWYSAHLGAQETWSQGTWREVVARADAQSAVRQFEAVRLDPPEDPLAAAQALEHEVMSGIDAAFPDARPSVGRLKKAGHRVFVATNATESNVRGALAGARLLEAIDGLFTGEELNAGKSGPDYWREIRERLDLGRRAAIAVDDRREYLAAAATAGMDALLLDRSGRASAADLGPPARAVLRNLAGLPTYLEGLVRGAIP